MTVHAPEFRSHHSSPPSHPRLTVVRDHATPQVAVSAHAGLDAKLATATREVVVVSSMSATAADPIALFRRIDHENLRRGVRYRVLFPDRARVTPFVAARLSALALSGAEVRTTGAVPMDALVIDGKFAVLPSEGQDGRQGGIAMFRLPSVVAATVGLFERVWSAAVPLVADEVPGGTGLTERERELLTLLSAGCTDESAAARLDISVRTVRRMVSGIMSRLGARSRFQAGVKAADRGWLVEGTG
ncbi:regulatory protein, luxR family [Amycolatopsis marina]|uniref:Regulatory protein, luxR family n=1 Tax=Amycolatopsis marina TaxID=490629 RepID=A0A1I1ADC6_9PSEU|nr:helix-turn-helix transcriptional regulator [Amycolatopsis marina]SFB36001.1 regulatory protein, luxR family [Amycolatopsis marina]